MLIVGDCRTLTARGRASALWVAGDRIAEVGEEASVAARHPGAPRLRVERVTPGLHDAHVHPTAWGQALGQLDLGGMSDPRLIAEAVAERARRLPPGAWVRGGGYLLDHHPDVRLLDQAAPANPVLLDSRDLHSAWASSAALLRAGIDATTPDPPGGAFVRDAAGAPSGTVLEKAVALVKEALPAPTSADLEAGLSDLAARGYTAAHAMDYEPVQASLGPRRWRAPTGCRCGCGGPFRDPAGATSSRAGGGRTSTSPR